MIRMLIIGYCFGIRSERRLCEEVQLNLAYRWFCRLSIEERKPTVKRVPDVELPQAVKLLFDTSGRAALRLNRAECQSMDRSQYIH
jgi:hypothetical protein